MIIVVSDYTNYFHFGADVHVYMSLYLKSLTVHVTWCCFPVTAVPKPIIESSPVFSLASQSRDSEPPEFALSFNVRVAPPTYVSCQVDSTPVAVADLSREVTSGQYLPPSTASPVTNVTVTLRTRKTGNYQCTVSVFRASGSNLNDVTSASVLVTG